MVRFDLPPETLPSVVLEVMDLESELLALEHLDSGMVRGMDLLVPRDPIDLPVSSDHAPPPLFPRFRGGSCRGDLSISFHSCLSVQRLVII